MNKILYYIDKLIRTIALTATIDVGMILFTILITIAPNNGSILTNIASIIFVVLLTIIPVSIVIISIFRPYKISQNRFFGSLFAYSVAFMPSSLFVVTHFRQTNDWLELLIFLVCLVLVIKYNQNSGEIQKDTYEYKYILIAKYIAFFCMFIMPLLALRNYGV